MATGKLIQRLSYKIITLDNLKIIVVLDEISYHALNQGKCWHCALTIRCLVGGIKL
jgi:hypothetical protein